MKTVAYCRVSTNKEEQLDSLESQRSFFLEYAKKQNYDLVHIYADEGKSGTRIQNRLQLQQLLIDGKNRKFELVLIKDVSRLARNTVDFLTSIRKLKSYDIKVVFVNYDQTSSDSSEFMLTMLSAIAQEESANISKRVKFGKRVNAGKGKVPNICYGYNKVKGDYFNLYINEEEAQVVKKIFKMYTQDLVGTGYIAKILNQKGIKTKRDYEWTQTGVKRVLTNEIYIGQIINAKEEVADFLTGRRIKIDEDKWIINFKPELQIVSNDIFEKAGAILRVRQNKHKETRERTSEKYVFTKLIWCKDCGSYYRRIVRSYKNTYIRWVCNDRNLKGADSCPNKSTIEEEDLLEYIKTYLKKILADNPKYDKYIISKACNKFKEGNNDFLQEKDYKRRLGKLEKEKSQYINLYKEGIIKISELKNFLADLEEDVNFIENELQLISNNISKIEIIEELVREMLKKFDCILEVKQITNYEIRKIIDKIIIDKEGLVSIYIYDIKNKAEKSFL